MDEQTNEPTNPLKPVEDEPISDKPAGNEGEAETIPPDPETKPAEGETPKPSMSPEMQVELKRLLRGTNRGKALMIRLDQIARPDLYKNAVQVNWVKDIQALDISVRPFDLNPGIFDQFRAYCWNNAMTYRFDDTSGVLVLVIRWFLPDVLPIMDPNMNAMAMMAPAPPAPLQEGQAPFMGNVPKDIPIPAKPDLKEVP